MKRDSASRGAEAHPLLKPGYAHANTASRYWLTANIRRDDPNPEASTSGRLCCFVLLLSPHFCLPVHSSFRSGAFAHSFARPLIFAFPFASHSPAFCSTALHCSAQHSTLVRIYSLAQLALIHSEEQLFAIANAVT